MQVIINILYALILLTVSVIIIITLMQNTKSEGLGAAITGASDSYRGAVGVEEQKRRLLQMLCFAFVILSGLVIVLRNWA
jgi:protein translocase SecG subunit